MPVIDVHAHVLAEDTIRRLQKEAPSIDLTLKPFDAEIGPAGSCRCAI